MLRQEASLPSEDEFAENRCGLNNAPSIPPAVSHFAVGWTEEGRNPSPVEDASRWAFAKPQPRPNHRPSIHLPQDWYASGCCGKPQHAPRARQPARACLCSAGTALRSHQDKPDLTRGRLLWLMIPPRIFSHSNLAPLDCCAGACVWVCMCERLSGCDSE